MINNINIVKLPNFKRTVLEAAGAHPDIAISNQFQSGKQSVGKVSQAHDGLSSIPATIDFN